MAPLVIEQIQRDDLAMSVGGAVAAANEAALAHGVQPSMIVVNRLEP